MAQIKISELPEAYDGTGYVPIVQYGETCKYDLGNKLDADQLGDYVLEYWSSAGNETISFMGYGHVTNGSKALELFFPWAKTYPGNYTARTLYICPRWSNVGYLYARSGSSGSTYQELHNGAGAPRLVWDNNASALTNEVSSVVVTPYQGGGFRIRINFVYALTINNTGTVIANNTCGDIVGSVTLVRA